MVTFDILEDALDDLDPGDLAVLVTVAEGFMPRPKCSFLPPTCPLGGPHLGIPLPFAHIDEGVRSALLLWPGGENGEAKI